MPGCGRSETHRLGVEHALHEALAQHDIRVLRWNDLTPVDRTAVREHYRRNIFPLVTPLAIDPAHPFPFVSNLSLNLLVTGFLRPLERAEPMIARVKVPVGQGIPRFLRVGTAPHFVRLEDVMAHTLDLLFPGLTVTSCELFRVTRNADTERDEEEADDLLELIESELRDRRVAPIVRLELETGMDRRAGRCSAELGLHDPDDVFETSACWPRATSWSWWASTTLPARSTVPPG